MHVVYWDTNRSQLSRRQVTYMRAERFDALILGLFATSRRGVARGAVGVLLATLTGGVTQAASRTCLVNGKPCHRDETCCSGICEGAICRPQSRDRSCPGKRRRCGGTCVNLRQNRKHCGRCHRACRAGDRCQKGKCVLSCPPGFTACGRKCVNLRTDFDHCGRCDRACRGDQRCAGNVCIDVCTDETCEIECGVTVDRKAVCAESTVPCLVNPDRWTCFSSLGCKPCSSPADCPPADHLVANLCLYTNLTGPCGEYEFACGWMS